jgi:hypothetical protein
MSSCLSKRANARCSAASSCEVSSLPRSVDGFGSDRAAAGSGAGGAGAGLLGGGTGRGSGGLSAAAARGSSTCAVAPWAASFSLCERTCHVASTSAPGADGIQPRGGCRSRASSTAASAGTAGAGPGVGNASACCIGVGGGVGGGGGSGPGGGLVFGGGGGGGGGTAGGGRYTPHTTGVASKKMASAPNAPGCAPPYISWLWRWWRRRWWLWPLPARGTPVPHGRSDISAKKSGAAHARPHCFRAATGRTLWGIGGISQPHASLPTSGVRPTKGHIRHMRRPHHCHPQRSQ